MYDMKQWKKDGTINPKEGEQITDEVFNEIFNCMPPAMNTRSIFQMGEAWDHIEVNNHYYARYYTFVKNDDKWYYIGLCINDEKTITEKANDII